MSPMTANASVYVEYRTPVSVTVLSPITPIVLLTPFSKRSNKIQRNPAAHEHKLTLAAIMLLVRTSLPLLRSCSVSPWTLLSTMILNYMQTECVAVLKCKNHVTILRSSSSGTDTQPSTSMVEVTTLPLFLIMLMDGLGLVLSVVQCTIVFIEHKDTTDSGLYKISKSCYSFFLSRFLATAFHSEAHVASLHRPNPANTVDPIVGLRILFTHKCQYS